MTHNMKLWCDPFNSIAYGSKTIELRLCDEKRQQINIGDTIVFNCIKNNGIITAKVNALHKFKDFKSLYENLPLDKCGYNEQNLNDAHYTDMEQYYSKEQIAKYGALGIELCDICAICDVKPKLLNAYIHTLLAPSVFEPTPEKLYKRALKYYNSDNTHAYAYIEDGAYMGIIVFKFSGSIATICDIAVNNLYCGRGIGRKLINFICQQFMADTIIAETDDDAVGFYKKCGFDVKVTDTEFDIKRYICELTKQS